MSLTEYKRKRDFKKTAEPGPKVKSSDGKLKFVVQKHAATRLHYDFRLELDGVLKSWAVPKGPSLDPKVKRLAMMVEDHPFDYRTFEGVIPKGEYGGGEVIVWDEGTYSAPGIDNRNDSIKQLRQGLEKGDLKFFLEGEKLRGSFVLVRTKGRGDNSWLLIKHRDEFASEEDVTIQDRSVVSGLTVEEIKEGGKGRIWTRKHSEINIEEGNKAKMPHKIKPMLATLVDEPFDKDNWIYEIKYDGYRAVAEIENGNVDLYSRNLNSFNQQFAPIVQSLKAIKMDAVLDGEIVILNNEGKPDFGLIQNYQRTGEGYIVYYVFDILYCNGFDLRDVPLLRRKEILSSILPEIENIIYSDHVSGKGIEFYKLAVDNKLEGIIAKQGESGYLAGRRSKEWLKIKTKLRQEAIICGFTAPKGGRQHFGALVLGVYENKKLKYIGHSGGGFDEDSLRNIIKLLKPLVKKESPFDQKVSTRSPITWVEPKLICEVAFSEWTSEGLMRHPVFLGLREDKKTTEVQKEIPASTSVELVEGKNGMDKEIIINKHKQKVTNLDKVFFPGEGYTKGDMIEYYRKISKYILPYLKDRPESMLRHPNGINNKGFFHKNVTAKPPDWVKTERIFSDSSEGEINYLICNDEASLVYMANLGCIEINPWFSRIQSKDNPDYFVIDLDPEEIAFDKVVETALAVKKVLDAAGAPSYPKTSGATGMHIYVPLKAKYDYDIAKDFAHLIARLANRIVPGFTSLERSPSKRKKKVYLDYLQNRRGQTLAAPYSVRPRPGATVSTPLKWEEVKIGLNPADFTIRTIFKRLEKTGDLFTPVLGKGIDVEKCINRLEKGGYSI